MPEIDERDTKERILDAAEELFSEQGFSATSLRTITSRADVNLAAVNYHFGSKESLIEAVFERRISPLNRERLQLLDALERSTGYDDRSLERIVEAFIGPALRLPTQHEVRGELFTQLLGQAMTQPPIREMFTEQFREVFDRFSSALHQALPDLPGAEVMWRFLFMVGAMAHTMMLGDELRRFSGGRCETTDVEATIQRLVPFLAAGLRASSPVVEASGS
jgi:AcrR family transcriptional regulator